MTVETQTAEATSTPAPEAPAAAPAPSLVVDGVDLSDIPFFKPDAPQEPAPEPAPAAEVAPEPEPEKPAEPPKEEPKAEPQTLKAIARLEKQLREEKERREKLEKDIASRQPVDELTEETALDILAAKGIKLERLVDQLVDGKKPKPADGAPKNPEFDKMRAELESIKKSAAEREAREQAQRQQAAEAQVKSEWRASFVDKAEEFPFLNAYGDEAVDLMFHAIKAHAEKTQADTGEPEFLDPSDVAKRLEAAYRAKHEKVAARLTPKPAPDKNAPVSSPQQTASRPPASGPKTLTNRAAASATPPPSDRPLTEEERLNAAAEALKFI